MTTSGRFGGAFVAALMVGTALAGIGVTNVASAQQASAAQQKIFQISAQPLASALTQLGQQSGMQVSVDAAAVRGLTSPGMSGSLTVWDAAARLLAGSGLNHRVDGQTIVISDRVSQAHAVPVADGSLVLDVIDVMGGRAAADAPFETAGSVSHISAEQISRTPPTSVGDVFRSTPGVIAAGNRVGASVNLNIRGLQGQNRVNVMVDGTRQSNHTYRGYSGSRNEVYVDPDFLGGIDISKGPSAGAGGVGAMGGVVNMRTIEAGDIVKDGQTFGIRAKGGLSGNSIAPLDKGSTVIRDSSNELLNGDSWSGSLAAGALAENYEFVAGFSRRKAGNYFAGRKGPSTFMTEPINPLIEPTERPLSPFGPGGEVLNTSQDVTSFMAKGKVYFGEGHSLGLSYIYYNNEYGEIDENYLPYSIGPGAWYKVRQNVLSETTTHTLKATYDFKPEDNGLVNLSSNLWFTDVESFSNVIMATSGGNRPGSEDVLTGISTVGGDISNELVFETRLGTFTTRSGFEFVHEKARENGASSPVNYLGANPNGTRALASVFNQSKLELNDWIALTGGLRYDYYRSEGTHQSSKELGEIVKDSLNPSIGVTVEPLEGLQFFTTYTEGWRPPSLRETAVGRAGTAVLPNPNLRPETSANVEVGVNLLRNDVFLAGDALRFKAAYFHNEHGDYIIRNRFVSPEGFWLYQWGNIDKAKFQGYEISTSYDAGSFFVEAGFTSYTAVNFCRDKPVDMITIVIPAGCGLDKAAFDYGAVNVPPKYSGSVTAGVRLLEERMTLGARAYFFGKRYGGFKPMATASNVAPYYHANTIVDVFGSYKLGPDAEMNFSVENIGDEYYLDPMSTGLVPSPGRTFRAGLTAKF